jgi:site-specific recombinase XerD
MPDMSLTTHTQRTITIVDDYLLTWIEAFLTDRKAQGFAHGTLRFYTQKLKLYADFSDGQAVKNINQITTTFIRDYLLSLEQTGHRRAACSLSRLKRLLIVV